MRSISDYSAICLIKLLVVFDLIKDEHDELNILGYLFEYSETKLKVIKDNGNITAHHK